MGIENYSVDTHSSVGVGETVREMSSSTSADMILEFVVPCCWVLFMESTIGSMTRPKFLLRDLSSSTVGDD